jgi:hypothetical protein
MMGLPPQNFQVLNSSPFRETKREIYMHPGLIIIARNTVNVYTGSLKDSGEWHKEEEEEEFTSETESRIDTHLMGFSWNLTSNCNCFPHMATIYRMIFWATVPKRFRFSYFMSRLLISTKHKQKHLLCPPCSSMVMTSHLATPKRKINFLLFCFPAKCWKPQE